VPTTVEPCSAMTPRQPSRYARPDGGSRPIDFPRVDKSPIKAAAAADAYAGLGIGGVILGANYAHKAHLKWATR
jgi:hypothetical protein